MSRFINKSWVKIFCAVVLLGALVSFVSPAELAREFASLSWAHIGLLLLLSCALIWVSAAKWRLFLGADAPSTSRLVRLYLVGYFVNSLLPSNVGGDATRSFLAGKRAGQVAAASATILERYTGLVAMFGLGVIASFTPAAQIVPIIFRVIIAAMALGLGLLTLVILWQRSFVAAQRLLPNKTRDFIARVREGLIAGLSNRAVLAEAFVLSLAYHCLTVLNTAVAAHAVGWTEVPLGQLFIVLPLILTIGGLPITPSGLGLQEGAFVYFLSLLGSTRAEGLAVGLLLRAKTYILALLGGVFLLFERQSKQVDIEAVQRELIKVGESTGSGRSNLVVISEQIELSPSHPELLDSYRILPVTVGAADYGKFMSQVLDQLEAQLIAAGVRSAIFVGLGDAATVVQAFTLRAPKVVRAMVLIDACSRPHPSRWMRWVSKLETYLPLGLPFRSPSTEFEALPFAHRLRSPCVVGISAQATIYQRAEAHLLAQRLPTAVLIERNCARGVLIGESLDALSKMPAKAPQKNRKA